MCFRPIGEHERGQEDNHHHCQQGPALTTIIDHIAESKNTARLYNQDGQRLQEIAQRCWILQWMCRVGIEEATAIGA